MQIQNITIVLRGTKGEVMKGVYDIEGNCISGSAEVKDVMQSAIEAHLHGAVEDESTDDSGSHAADTGDHEGATGADAGTIDTSE